MHSDCFIKGIHAVCQDYAIVVPDKVILSDGCSSSPGSEVGAHLIPIIANNKEDYFWSFYLDRPPLDKVCFDATLVKLEHIKCSDPKDNFMIAWALGDGMFIAHRRDGKIEIIDIEFSENAPYYISYEIDKEKKNRWFEQYPNNKKIVSKYDPDNDFVFRTDDEYPAFIHSEIFDCKKYDSVYIASDGLKSFKDNTAKEISLRDVINKILDIKNYSGVFLQRAMTKMLRDFHAQGIAPYDDISIAGFYWGDEK